MAERPPNRFQKNQQPIVEYESSESEESRPIRTRQPTARYVDEVSLPQRARYAAIRKKKIQRCNTQIEELKRQDRAARLGLSEPDLSDSQTQTAKRVRTDLGSQGAVNNLGVQFSPMSQLYLDLPLRLAIWLTKWICRILRMWQSDLPLRPAIWSTKWICRILRMWQRDLPLRLAI